MGNQQPGGINVPNSGNGSGGAGGGPDGGSGIGGPIVGGGVNPRQQQQQQQQQHQQQHHGGYTGGGYQQQQQQQSYHNTQQQQPQTYNTPYNIPSANPNQVISGPGGGIGIYNQQQQQQQNVDAYGQQQQQQYNQQQQQGGYNTMEHRSNSDASMTLIDNNVLAGIIENTTTAPTTTTSGKRTGVTTTTTGTTSTGTTATTNSILENWLDDDTVPTVFRWEHGGRQVYITGTFNGWSRQIPMHRSGNDFTYIHNLKRGKHAFKFIVDDEWRFAPDQPTVADIEGRINNFIDVTMFVPYTGDKDFEKEKSASEYGILPITVPTNTTTSATTGTGTTSSSDNHHQNNTGNKIDPTGSNAGGDSSYEGGSDSNDQRPVTAVVSTTSTTTTVPSLTSSLHGTTTGTTAGSSNRSNNNNNNSSGKGIPDQDGEIFTTTMPDMDDFTKEPPPLPPHLRHIILNKPPQLSDTTALPVPQHVALNHLYCTAIKDNMMVLGITQRYKTKYVTTVYYSPCGK